MRKPVILLCLRNVFKNFVSNFGTYKGPHVVNKKVGEFIADNERKSILKGQDCVAPNR